MRTTTTRKLPTVVPFLVAGRACFGMERTAIYGSRVNGTFPVPVIRAGGRWVVATAELRRVLGLSAEELADVLGLDDNADSAAS